MHHQGLVCGLRQIVLGKEEKQQICFLLNRLLLDQRRVVPVCWGFIYKTLWNLNCHCLSKEGSLVHSIAQSFGCPIAHTEIFAKGHSNLDLVQRFLPELVLRGRQVLLGRICSVNLLSCYWRDNVSRVCRSDLFIRRHKEDDLWAPWLLKWKGKLVWYHASRDARESWSACLRVHYHHSLSRRGSWCACGICLPLHVDEVRAQSVEDVVQQTKDLNEL